MLLEDYIYFANKAVQQYINKVYNRFDVNQQSSDDLRWLQTTTILKIVDNKSALSDLPIPKEKHTWCAELPIDYLHMLNCIIKFDSTSENKKKDCSDSDTDSNSISSLARRLTANQYPMIISNYYLKPSYNNPYFYINNINGAFTGLKLEIRCGDDTYYTPNSVFIDYLRKPQEITLTYEQIEDPTIVSETLEFPDYVAYEIINEFSKLVMENASDPRIQTNIPINQTIANPLATK